MVSAISFTCKKENRDTCLTVSLPDHNLEALVITDGVGNLEFAGPTSKFIANSILQLIKKGKISINFNDIFYELYTHAKAQGWDFNQSKTTLITLIKFKNELITHWLGNGSLFILKPEHLLDSPPAPNNILIPDAFAGNVLTKFISPQTSFKPNFMHLKLNSSFCVIAGSDGLFSSESAELLTDDAGDILLKIPDLLLFILSGIKKQILEQNSLNLDQILLDARKTFIDKIEDDTSIGILISETFTQEFLEIINKQKI